MILSQQGSSIIDLNMLSNVYPEFRGSINNIKEKRLPGLLDTKQICKMHFYYDSETKNFAIEDPALFYYLKYLDWEQLRIDCGFKSLYLFSTQISEKDFLNKENVSEPLLKEFENHKIFLSNSRIIKIVKTDESWEIIDKEEKWLIKKDGQTLNIYRSLDKNYEYDFAISFAGENRELAKYITEQLEILDAQVFYDEYFEANFLGKTWREQLKKVFNKDSRLIICLLDENHDSKIWPTFERECFKPRIKEGAVIPIFLDNTPFDGIPQDLNGVYFQWNKANEKWKDEVIDKIIFKVMERLDQE